MALLASSAQALTPAQALAIATGETDARIEALNKAVADADDKTAAFIQALADDAVKVAGDKVLLVKDGKGFDPVTGAPSPLPADAEDVINNNRMRGEIDTALAALKLFSKDDTAARRGRQGAAQRERRVAAAADREGLRGRDQIRRSRSNWGWCAPPCCWAAATSRGAWTPRRLLAQSSNPNTKTLLIERLKTESDPDVKAALQALAAHRRRLAGLGRQGWARCSPASAWARSCCWWRSGLAITYGLMGVINMAHGELMMIGAYATYVVQGLFQQTPAGRVRLVPGGRGAGGIRRVAR